MIKETPRVTYDVYIKVLQEIQQLAIMQREATILGQEDALVKDQLQVISDQLVELRKTVPALILSKFDQLMLKSGAGVIDLLDSKRCGACRVSLVPDVLVRMKVNRISPNCHSCGKYLDVWKK